MDTFDILDSFENCLRKKEIYLDDIPVDSLLFRNVRRSGPTPADIVLLWKKGFHLDDFKKKILLSILENDIMIASDTGMAYEADTLINEALKESANDPEAAFRHLIALINLHHRSNYKKSKEYYRRARLLKSESGIKPDKITGNMWKIIMNRMDKP